MLSIAERAVASSIELPAQGRRGDVSFATAEGGDRVEADLIVVATGLRSLRSKLVSAFREMTGYRPPRAMPACVTEIDLSSCGGTSIGGRLLILNGIIPDSVIALIPMQVNWLTVAALKRVLTVNGLRCVFANPVVREYVQLDDVELSLVCEKVCGSDVFVGKARNTYGDGWVVLGDLAGYGRVLKDGYFAALLGADLAARTVAFHGCSREAFARNYHAGVRQFDRENRMGMELFALNNVVTKSGIFNQAMVDALSWEGSRHP